MGNLDRGLDQLSRMWRHPRFMRSIHDGQERHRDPLPEVVRKAVIARDRAQCRACGAQDTVLQVDHIVPVTAGGTDLTTNLQTLCEPCNTANRLTIDVVASKPRPIVALCHTDVGTEGEVRPDLRLLCVTCHAYRNVESGHALRFELVTYLANHPGFLPPERHIVGGAR